MYFAVCRWAGASTPVAGNAPCGFRSVLETVVAGYRNRVILHLILCFALASSQCHGAGHTAQHGRGLMRVFFPVRSGVRRRGDKKERPKQRTTGRRQGLSEHSTLQYLHEQQCPPPGRCSRIKYVPTVDMREWCHCAVLGRVNLRCDLWFGTVTTSDTGGRSKKARLCGWAFSKQGYNKELFLVGG